MVLERRGSQYRIRFESPKKFEPNSFRTKDVGAKGGLKLIIGRKKGSMTTSSQALRVSTRDFDRHGKKLYPTTKRGLLESKYIPKAHRGKGWHGEHARHSMAARRNRTGYCPTCNTKSKYYSKYCQKCGTKLR